MPPLTASCRLRNAGLRFVSVGGTAQECATLAASKTSCGDLIFCTDTRDRSLATRVLDACGWLKRERQTALQRFALCLVLASVLLDASLQRTRERCPGWSHRSRALVSRPGSVPALDLLLRPSESKRLIRHRLSGHCTQRRRARICPASMQPQAEGCPSTMEIRSLQPFGVEVVGCDLNDATDDDVRRIYDAMESDNGCGVVCVRDQNLQPEALERMSWRQRAPKTLIALQAVAGPVAGGVQAVSTWRSWEITARRDGEMVEGLPEGEQIGEFNQRSAWSRRHGRQRSSPRRRAPSHCARSGVGSRPRGISPRRPSWRPAYAGRPTAAIVRRRFTLCARNYDALEDRERAELGALASGPFLEELHAPPRAPGSQAPENHARRRGEKPDVCWPLVRRHPDTGRLSLYLNPKNTRRVTSCRAAGGLPSPAGRSKRATRWSAASRSGHWDGRLRARLEEGRRRPLGQPPATPRGVIFGCTGTDDRSSAPSCGRGGPSRRLVYAAHAGKLQGLPRRRRAT